MSVSGISETADKEDIAHYNATARQLKNALQNKVKVQGVKLFSVTLPKPLKEVYYSNIPWARTDLHGCRRCEDYLESMGTIVTINPDFSLRSVAWDESVLSANNPYRTLVQKLREAVEHADTKIDAIYEFPMDETKASGKDFVHWTFRPDVKNCFNRRDISYEGHLNTFKENFLTFRTALTSINRSAAERALAVLEMGKIFSPEKMLPQAKFLVELQTVIYGDSGNEFLSPEGPTFTEHSQRVMWRAVATAPAGWLTPRSSLLGTLIDYIDNGSSEEAFTAAMNQMLDPTKYQRAQKEASDAEVVNARRLFEKLGLTPALRRTYATLDDIETVWRSAESHVRDWEEAMDVTVVPSVGQGSADAGPNPFDTLLSKPKGGKGAKSGAAARKNTPKDDVVKEAGVKDIAYDIFVSEVLPSAEGVWADAPVTGNYAAMTTATNKDAPMIYKWDSEERRNPTDFYLYTRPSKASDWNITVKGTTWVPVTAIAHRACHWANDKAYSNMAPTFFIMLSGCRDLCNKNLCLFSESLRSDLHPVRRVIETMSEELQMDPLPEKYLDRAASGIAVFGGKKAPTLRVKASDGKITAYNVVFNGYSAETDSVL
jgi:hypothetical protein